MGKIQEQELTEDHQQQLVLLAQLNHKLRERFSRVLKAAGPNTLRCHQLANIMKLESPESSIDSLKTKIRNYFNLPFEKRTSRSFRQIFRVAPYPWLENQFILDFSSVAVPALAASQILVEYRELISKATQSPPELVSEDILLVAIHKTMNPRPDTKIYSLDLTDLATAWRDLSLQRFGSQYEWFFNNLISLLQLSDKVSPNVLKPNLKGTGVSATGPTHLVTQTDLDWIGSILAALNQGERPPSYPLSRAPRDPRIRRVEDLVRQIAASPANLKAGQAPKDLQSLCTDLLNNFGLK